MDAVLEAWLAMARAAGLHASAIDLSDSVGRLALGPWSTDGGIVRTAARWQSRYGRERQEWDASLTFRVRWDLGDRGLRVADLELDEDTVPTLLAWGADSGSFELPSQLRRAVADAIGAPMPLPRGWVADDGALRLGGTSIDGEGDRATSAWLRDRLPEGVTLGVRGRAWTLTAGGEKLRWADGEAPPIAITARELAEVAARRGDATHDEVHGLRLDLAVTRRDGDRVCLEVAAVPWRGRRVLPVDLIDVVVDGLGLPARLGLRTARDEVVVLPVAHARAARARGTLGPARVVAPLDDATLRALQGWGLVEGDAPGARPA